MMPTSVSQSSTWSSAVAHKAIDDDLTTISNTKDAWGTTVWYKMTFDSFYCFSEIEIINSHWEGRYVFRMQDLNVLVVDSYTQRESLCGTLAMRKDQSVEGQTYRVPCDGKYGNEVKLTVYHGAGDYGYRACIHMSEILAYHTPSPFPPGLRKQQRAANY